MVSATNPGLALEQDARRGARVVDRKNDYGAGVVDKIATNFDACGFEDLVGCDPEDGSAIDGARGKQAGFGFPVGTLGRSGFWHADNIKHGVTESDRRGERPPGWPVRTGDERRCSCANPYGLETSERNFFDSFSIFF